MRPSVVRQIVIALAVGAVLVPAQTFAAQAGRVEVREGRPQGRRDTVVLRVVTTGNEAEVLRVVNELRSREARILRALAEVPFDRPNERRELEEELARISREAFTVISVIESRCLEEKATAPSGYLGVNITSEVEVNDQRVKARSVITSVEPGSPAERAGVAAGDRLLSVAGRDARERLPELAGVLEPGRRLAVRVEREGREREFQVTVAPRPRGWDHGCPRFERALQPLRMGGVARIWVRDSTDNSGNRFVFVQRPEVSQSSSPSPVTPATPTTAPTASVPATRGVRGSAAVPPTPPTPAVAPEAPAAPMVFAYGTSSGGGRAIGYFAGAQFRALDDDWRNVLGLRRGTEGVLVNEVAPGSPAAAAGLRVGDVITSINGTTATSPLVVVRLLSLDEDRQAALRVIRARDARSVTFRWGGDRAPQEP